MSTKFTQLRPGIGNFPDERVTVLGVNVHIYKTVDALHEDLLKLIRLDKHALVLNVNVHAMNLAYEQPWLKAFFNQAEIVFCDGRGVVWGAKLLGQSIPITINYGYWMWRLGAFLEAQNFSIYLLGGKPGIAEQAAARLHDRFPLLRIVGTQHGYFDKTAGAAENARVIDGINAVKPDVLLVCFGMPLQEAWLQAHWDALQVKVALTGGAALDYTAAVLPRSPEWMSAIGMEWFWRMIIEPRRLWRRYVIGNPKFLTRILRAKFRSNEQSNP